MDDARGLDSMNSARGHGKKTYEMNASNERIASVNEQVSDISAKICESYQS